jgi:predicted RNase H-like HicB family nuclease
MQIPVAIVPTELGGFRAESVSPFTVVAEGSTREEAVSKVQAELNQQIESGSVVLVEVGAKTENPWLKMAGRLKDDPLFDEWRAAVEEYRRQCDIEAGIEYEERP